MTEALIKQTSEAEKMRLALLIVTAPTVVEGEEAQSIDATLEGIAEKMKLSTAEIAEMLNDKKFLGLLKGFTKARAALAIHGPVFNRLVNIAINGSNKDAIQAGRMLMQYTGDLKEKVEVNVRHTFDTLRKEWGSQESADPLSQIFKIRGVDQVIDAEVLEGDASDD